MTYWNDLPDADDEPTRQLELLRRSLLTGKQLASLPPPSWLIDGIVPSDALVVLYGPPGVFKTFVAMDWALSTATGSWWMGHPLVKGPSLYVASEGSHGLTLRRAAWMAHHRVYTTDGDHWLTRSVNLLNPEEAAALVELARKVDPVVVFVDTLARSMPGGEENGSRDMGKVIDAADSIRVATGATVVLVHHTPRNGDNPRGHTSLEGAVDTMVEVRAEGERSIVLRCTKQKEAAEFVDIRLGVHGAAGSLAIGRPVSSVSAADMTDSGREMLRALAGADLGDGLSPSRWHAVSGLAVRTAFLWQKKLVDAGYCKALGDGKRKLYTITEQGKRVLAGNETAELPANCKDDLAVSEKLLQTPPPLGVAVGSNGSSCSDRETVPVGDEPDWRDEEF